MKRFRDPNWVLILLFLGVLAVVPVVQTIIELRGDEGVVALELFGDRPTAENLRAFEHKLEAPSWAARLSRPWLQYANFTWLKEGGEKVVVGTDGWYFFKPGLKDMLARRDTGQPSNATNDPVAAIVDFRDQLAVRGVRLLLLPVPNKESIYPDRLTSRAKDLRGVVAPRTQEVLQKLNAAGVEVVDLFKEFAEARQRTPDTTLYLAQDTHWSPAGVSLASRAVARRLTGLGWIQPGHATYRERFAPVHRLGDILRMLQTPRIEQGVIPESVASMQVVGAESGKPYADEASAEILILGDSFMRIYQTDTPNSAGFISHLANELKQPMMSIVNDGGGSTLVREELCSRTIFLDKKKVVVWEFVERDLGIGIKGWRRTPLPPVSKLAESH
jgi:hypothetical protein